MTYRKVPISVGNRVIDWAETNNVDWDIWNTPELFGPDSDTLIMELGLEDGERNWPIAISCCVLDSVMGH